MKILKRLKNLWELSEYTLSDFQKVDFEGPIGTKSINRSLDKPTKQHQMATIIKLRPKDEIEEILKNG